MSTNNISLQENYSTKFLEVMAMRNVLDRPLIRAFSEIMDVAKVYGQDVVNRNYTIRRKILTGGRGSKVALGSSVKSGLQYSYKNTTHDILYGEIFLQEDVRNVEDRLIDESNISEDLINALLESIDAAYIGDPQLFKDGALQVGSPIKTDNNLLQLSANANADATEDWSNENTTLLQIYNQLLSAKDFLRAEDKAKRTPDSLYISQEAYERMLQKPYASDNQRAEDKLNGIFSSIVVDPYLNDLSFEGTSLGAVAFIYDSRDIKHVTDLAPRVMRGSPSIINNTLHYGVETRIGGMHNVSQYDNGIYRINNLLTTI